MEEKKFDVNTIVGFLLIGAILLYMLWQNAPTPEELEAQQAEKEKTEQIENDNKATEAVGQKDILLEKATTGLAVANSGDSLGLSKLQNRLGSFAYSGTLPSANNATTVIENEVLKLTVSNKGGYIVEAKLKEQTIYDGSPVYLIKDGNSSLNLQFSAENRLLNSQDLYFEPSVSNNGENKVLSMKLKTSGTDFIEYRYELIPNDYMLGFSIKTQGLENVINTSQPIYLDWNFIGYRHAKSISYENRYSRLTYEYENGEKHSKLSPASDDDELEKDVTWMNFRQHFFSSMLLTDTAFKEVALSSIDLVKDEEVDTLYTKKYGARMLLEPKSGSFSYDMNMYYGPTDYQVFKSYDRNLDEALPLGWGIFGFLNKYLV
ncbi:MAG: YidC/Oxa1 family membrane protein insertase, partial [Flavobacteriaceae bacterium]